MSEAAHDRLAIDTVGGTIQDNLTKLVTGDDMSERRYKERMGRMKAMEVNLEI